jgi:molecular chaperone DnaJ
VDVPAGVPNNTRLKMTGMGEVGPGGGPPGDLYIEINELPDRSFKRAGNNLLATLEIPMTAAALGTTLELETLDGPQEIHIKPGTQPGEVITLKGLGVNHLRDNGRGDLKVTIRVIVPNNLTEPQIQLLREFETARGDEPSDYNSAVSNMSFFDKVKDKLAGK